MREGIDGAVGEARRRAAVALRARIAGGDAERRADQIWGRPGERWFGPEDPVWRVHADTSMFVGGIRALLLQALHPLAMAGVADHSGFQGDPWGRLQRTGHYIATTTYGTVPDAERMIAAVRRIHEGVVGVAPDGRPYAAGDPHLLRWVHVAEADSFLQTYQRFGARPLDAGERDAYVRQAGVAARLLGAEDVPETYAGLQEALEGFRPELHATPAARQTADYLLRTPPLEGAARAGYWTLAAGAVATLPRWAREELGLRVWGARPVVPLARATALAATRATRWVMSDPSVSNRSRSQAAGAA